MLNIFDTSSKIGLQIFFKGFTYLFAEREEGTEKEKEWNINVQEIHQSVDSHLLTTGDLAHNPGMCIDRELNQQPFGSQASDQSTEPHQPWHKF